MTADCLRLRSTCTEVQTVRSRLETARKLDNIECVDDSLYFRDKKASLFAWKLSVVFFFLYKTNIGFCQSADLV